jgi:hypothetical protein
LEKYCIWIIYIRVVDAEQGGSLGAFEVAFVTNVVALGKGGVNAHVGSRRAARKESK